MDTPAADVTGVLTGERGVTAEMALLLGRRFETTPEFWMNLQAAHDLDLTREKEQRTAL